MGINIGTGCRTSGHRYRFTQNTMIIFNKWLVVFVHADVARRKTILVVFVVCKKGFRTERCNSTPDKTKYSWIRGSRRARMRRAEPPGRLSARGSREIFCVEIITH